MKFCGSVIAHFGAPFLRTFLNRIYRRTKPLLIIMSCNFRKLKTYDLDNNLKIKLSFTNYDQNDRLKRSKMFYPLDIFWTTG